MPGVESLSSILITGASRGLGLELTRQYLAEGWQVHAAVRNPAQAVELQQLCSTHAATLNIHRLDIEDHGSIEQLSQELTGITLDVLLNSAGTMGNGSFAVEGLSFGAFGRSDYADWARVFRINVMGPMKMAEAFVEHVAASRQKKIVTLTSILGSIEKNRVGGLYAYRSSKAAVNAVMRSMSIDLLRDRGIKATALHPGWVKTDMGGPRADIDAATSVRGMRAVIAALDETMVGRYWMYDGTELPW
jgi:NAD(P)-dependent dehydrogenase (short-subunit alcohol dehydrogenase family)